MATEAPATVEPTLVRPFDGNAHGDLDAVRAALAAEPKLANAAWDWGGGDWETALGAAAHMGRRDIEVEVVRAIIAAHPEARVAKGPHGIPLVAHAEAGGEQARAVVELLAR